LICSNRFIETYFKLGIVVILEKSCHYFLGNILPFLVKNRHFGKKNKFWSKIEVLVKNPNFGKKSEFLSKSEILVNNSFGELQIIFKPRNICEHYIFQLLKAVLKVLFLL